MVDCLPEFIEKLRGYFGLFLSKTTPAVVFPIITVLLIALFFIYQHRVSQPIAGTTEWIIKKVTKTRFSFISARHPMEKKDIAPLIIIAVVFAFLALFKLGDTAAPQSFFQFSHEKQTVLIELHTPEQISSLMYYTGLWSGHYTLEMSADGVNWHEQRPVADNQPDGGPEPAMNQPRTHLFKWRYASLNDDNPAVRYIRLTASNTPLELGELAIYGSDGALVPRMRIISLDAPELFDEQKLAPLRPTYMNGMYFYEVYQARTGYEFTRGLSPYETIHPPLGKEIIAASIFTFGMTPFGWRFIGAVFGVVMLVVLYIFIKNLFGKTAVSVCGTLLFGFDFMRFVQTRIATTDTYGVFFILLAYFFMYRHITTDAEAPFRKSLAPLALSGVAFGLGCASKWFTVFAGLGLAAIYIIRLILLGIKYKEEGLRKFGAYLARTLFFSVLFFCLIPVIIYCLSYIPYGLANGMTLGGGMLWNREFYKVIWNNQVAMLEYHRTLEAVHPYSSKVWQWILNARPILYVNTGYNSLRSTLGAFGNPIIWWGGFVALCAAGVRAVKSRDGKAAFILIGYLSQVLPWIAVTRVVFAYHYFTGTLFLVLALTHIFNAILDRGPGRYCRHAVYGFTAAAGIAFAMFYPALTGIYTPNWYFTNVLRWIPGAWPF